MIGYLDARNEYSFSKKRTATGGGALKMISESYLLINDDEKPSRLKHGNGNSWREAVQMFVSFLLAGYGMVAASLLLDRVQHWTVFVEVSEVYILVPALLGLKGNLEMTLASRLATHAHLGHVDRHLGSLVIGNLCLVQCQAVLVGFVAAMVAVAIGWIPVGQFSFGHGLLLCASSVLTASLASFVLGLVMVLVVVLSTKLNIDPDNVATPIAASLGDLITLALLASISMLLYIDTSLILAPIIIIVGAALVPICGYVAWKNHFTKRALKEGWIPVLAAMVISSAGGLILDYTMSNYMGIAVFQLVINGIGGNMVAVHASRLSTSFHMGRYDESVFGKTTRLLLFMVVPCQLIFVYSIAAIKAGDANVVVTPLFVFVYMCAAFCQVLLLLVLSHYIVVLMWKLDIDPDNSAIPYLTALGDLIGTAFLGLAFYMLYGVVDSSTGSALAP